MTRIKVCIVVNELLRGGAQRIILDLVSAIDQDIFDVTVVALKADSAFPQHTASSLYDAVAKAGATVYTISSSQRSSWSEFLALIRLLRRVQPDIVHTFLPYAGVLGRVAARIAGVPHVLSTQCNVRVAYRFKEYWMDRLTLPFAEKWTAAAECIEQEYGGSVAYVSSETLKLNRRHMTIVAGVDVAHIQDVVTQVDRTRKREMLGVDPSEIMVLMTARLISWKGHEDLIRTLPHVPRTVHLYFAGWGELRDRLHAIARELGVDARVHFLGARSDVYELLAAADLFAQPFGRDAHGHMWMGPNTSQMEACAAGVPSITTAVPLMEYLIEDEVTGKVAQVNDPESLAAALRWMLEHPEQAAACAKRAQTRVSERYSLSRMVRSYEQLYRSFMMRS